MVQCLCEEARAMGAFIVVWGSPLFSTMFKSIDGGGRGGSAICHPKISESGPQPIDTLIYLYLHI